MKTIENFPSLLNRVQAGLEEVSMSKQPNNLYEPIRYILEAGGKRIRPVFALMGCQMFGGSLEKALYPALGLEYFHNFTLLHDDVMDCADVRRGRPTVHKKWNQNTAILSGDAMFTLACMLIQRAPSSVSVAVNEAFQQVSLGVCEGQQYDMDFESLHRVSMAQYMEMIRLKTAVLLSGSLQIGALCAEANSEQVQQLYRIGEKLGLAFQLQDDWLDLYGEEAKFGKKIGSDIREKKKTYLYLRALEWLPSEEADLLLSWFKPGKEVSVDLITNMYEKAHIKDRCVQEIKQWYALAEEDMQKLPQMGANTEAVEVFSGFARELLGRDF